MDKSDLPVSMLRHDEDKPIRYRIWSQGRTVFMFRPGLKRKSS
jgi:hypothetical protein